MDKSKTVSFRYIVNDVDKAMSFYKEFLDFEVDMHPAPGFAALTKENLRLYLNQPGVGGAGQEMPDGQLPEPGGWNRIQISVDNLESEYSRLSKKGAKFRNEIVNGQGGKQILLQDPSGNLIELFEPKQ
jgi:predicted enzyme related to lactoylglutathione lyase